MKKLIILLMAAALGATTYSCNDQDFSDVEQTVMNVNMDAPIDQDEQARSKPGD